MGIRHRNGLFQIVARAGIAVAAFALIFSAFPQTQVPAPKRGNTASVEITALASDSAVKPDSILSVKVVAENKGRNVVVAVVTLVDSASGDTIDKWYPLFPPQSADSITLFWNTKAAAPGNHTLTGILTVYPDSTTPKSRLSRTISVSR